MQMRWAGAFLVAGLLAGIAQAEPANAPIDRSAPLNKQIDQAIANGMQFLLARQRDDGAWIDGFDPQEDVGRTALVGMALLSCGMSHQSPQMMKTIEYLKKAKIDGRDSTYSYALRAAFYSQLPQSLRKTELPADLDWLQNSIIRKGRSAGMYSYHRHIEGISGDYSNSQYGVLGSWYAEMAGLEVDTGYWRLVENAWRGGQAADGGFGYRFGDSESYASMTAAAAATLYITNDYLHASQELDLNRTVRNVPLDNTMKWLGDHFAVDYNSGRDRPPPMAQGGDILSDVFGSNRAPAPVGSWVHYMLFAYERVGEASGLTRFGTHKWFEEGSRYLLDTQNYDGSWEGTLGRTIDTSYALLFLARGRSPVVMQKLQFPAWWDNRSRDAAAVSRWISRETERHTNWQIVPVEASAAEFREAPILYVASNHRLALREAEKQRIKTYLDQGGLLFAVNEGPTKEFAESIEKLGTELYPAYEFRNLPEDHLIYTENFTVKGLQTTPRALSNGMRELMVLLPTGDITWKFQLGAGTIVPAAAGPFSFVGNIYVYLNDKSNPRFKGDDTWIDADPNARDLRQIAVARLKLNANWNPEPAGWTRFANILHNTDNIRLNITPVNPEINAFPEGTALAHLTATNKFEFTKLQQDILKRYLDAGGLLVFDAAGGSTDAQLSLETLLIRLYPLAKLKPLPIDHPIYTGQGTGGAKIEQVTYRPFAQQRLPRTTLPRLREMEVDGRIVAIDSPEDLSAGLVGFNTDGIVGYSPASSVALMRNIVLWRTGGTAK